MKKIIRNTVLGLAIAGTATLVNATPSTQIWIPSTDTQPFNVWHLGLDNYVRSSGTSHFTAGQRDPNIYDAGLTVGVLPFDLIKAEVGADYLVNGTPYDSNPVYFNAKVGLPEGALFTNSVAINSPALAVVGFNFGTNSKKGSATRTDQNIVYGEIAETLPVVGRFSVGYYTGNGDVLVGTDGDKANNGILASWDRTMSEISDKLWFAVDYMGGGNFNSGVSFGASWAFSKNTSVIFGYDMWDKPALAGANTFTIQLDINFP